jgi:hypothetical protein
MPISSDFSINYNAKTVTHTSGTDVYTVLAFFQWLAATFAASSQMDDDYAFVSDTPTVYRWVNGWAFGSPTNDYKFLRGGGITSSDSNYIWSNLYSIGAQETGTQIALFQADAEITPWWPTGNIDILVLVKSGGVWIQSDNTAGIPTDGGVWVYARKYGDLYDHGYVDLAGGGRNPVGVNTSPDAGNTSLIADASIWASDLSIGFGTISRNLNNGAGFRPYDVQVDCSGHTMTQVYEALKFVTRYGSLRTLNGDAGQEYRSASEGNYAEVKVAPFGTLAGSTVYGARGVWFNNAAAATFVLKDANNVTQNPPNYQKVTATNTDLGGCNVFVTEVSNGNIWKDQYTINASSATSVYTKTQIDANRTPQSGSLRVGDARFIFTSFDGSVFLGVSPDPHAGLDGSLYVPLLDGSTATTSLSSDNIIYAFDINVRTVVRKYGFKPYTADTPFRSSGLSFSPILSLDPQAT